MRVARLTGNGKVRLEAFLLAEKAGNDNKRDKMVE